MHLHIIEILMFWSAKNFHRGRGNSYWLCPFHCRPLSCPSWGFLMCPGVAFGRRRSCSSGGEVRNPCSAEGIHSVCGSVLWDPVQQWKPLSQFFPATLIHVMKLLLPSIKIYFFNQTSFNSTFLYEIFDTEMSTTSFNSLPLLIKLQHYGMLIKEGRLLQGKAGFLYLLSANPYTHTYTIHCQKPDKRQITWLLSSLFFQMVNLPL